MTSQESDLPSELAALAQRALVGAGLCWLRRVSVRKKTAALSLRRAFMSLLKDPMLLSVYIFILSYLAVIRGNAPNCRKV